MSKTIGIAIAVVVVAGGAWYALSRLSPTVLPSASGSPAAQTTQQPSSSGASESPAAGLGGTNIGADALVEASMTRDFVIEGRKFSFTPPAITVKKGTVVRVVFKNADGFHDFRIDEFNVATPKINGGEEATVTFTADKVGSFEYYCSVGNHRAMGMKGTLTVTE